MFPCMKPFTKPSSPNPRPEPLYTLYPKQVYSAPFRKTTKVGGLQSVLIWTPALQLLELSGVMSPLYFLLPGKQPLLGTVPLDAVRAQELLAPFKGREAMLYTPTGHLTAIPYAMLLSCSATPKSKTA